MHWHRAFMLIYWRCKYGEAHSPEKIHILVRAAFELATDVLIGSRKKELKKREKMKEYWNGTISVHARASLQPHNIPRKSGCFWGYYRMRMQQTKSKHPVKLKSNPCLVHTVKETSTSKICILQYTQSREQLQLLVHSWVWWRDGWGMERELVEIEWNTAYGIIYHLDRVQMTKLFL